MKIEELIEKLGALPKEQEGGCYSDGHKEADRLLIAFINDMRVKIAFDEVGKWYD